MQGTVHVKYNLALWSGAKFFLQIQADKGSTYKQGVKTSSY